MDSRDEELLVELRRNTAAVRALGRFALVEATAVIVSGFAIALGVVLLPYSVGLASFLIFAGAVVLILGTIVSVTSGWREFHASDRVESAGSAWQGFEKSGDHSDNVSHSSGEPVSDVRFWCPRCREYFVADDSPKCPDCGRDGHPAPEAP